MSLYKIQESYEINSNIDSITEETLCLLAEENETVSKFVASVKEKPSSALRLAKKALAALFVSNREQDLRENTKNSLAITYKLLCLSSSIVTLNPILYFLNTIVQNTLRKVIDKKYLKHCISEWKIHKRKIEDKIKTEEDKEKRNELVLYLKEIDKNIEKLETQLEVTRGRKTFGFSNNNTSKEEKEVNDMKVLGNRMTGNKSKEVADKVANIDAKFEKKFNEGYFIAEDPLFLEANSAIDKNNYQYKINSKSNTLEATLNTKFGELVLTLKNAEKFITNGELDYTKAEQEINKAANELLNAARKLSNLTKLERLIFKIDGKINDIDKKIHDIKNKKNDKITDKIKNALIIFFNKIKKILLRVSQVLMSIGNLASRTAKGLKFDKTVKKNNISLGDTTIDGVGIPDAAGVRFAQKFAKNIDKAYGNK